MLEVITLPLPTLILQKLFCCDTWLDDVYQNYFSFFFLSNISFCLYINILSSPTLKCFDEIFVDTFVGAFVEVNVVKERKEGECE